MATDVSQAAREPSQASMNAAADFLESWTPGPEMTVVKLARLLDQIRQAARAEADKIAAAAQGYLLNLKIDLETSVPRAKVLENIERARAAIRVLAQPEAQEE